MTKSTHQDVSGRSPFVAIPIWLLKKLIRMLLLLTLIAASNALLLTNSLANALFSSALDRIPGVQSISTKHKNEIAKKNKTLAQKNKKIAKSRNLTKKIGSRIVSRTRKVTAASLAAIPAESIPFIGVSVLLAGTAYEVHAACETVNDLNEIYDALEINDKTDSETLTAICNPKELADERWSDFKHGSQSSFDKIIEQSKAWKDEAIKAFEDWQNQG